LSNEERAWTALRAIENTEGGYQGQADAVCVIREALEAARRDERERCANICLAVQAAHEAEGCTCSGPSDAYDEIMEA
jgi:hypothetical protein